jgi:hypothetical protein
MNDKNLVSIEWESSGYSVLKNLNSSVLGIFCEFIDNSLQSYREQKNEILKYDKNYQLKIDIDYIDGKEIIIRDNAGGINQKNFKRALKPANKPEDTTGYNEFGLGMKYAAVWISNEWELKSSAIGESVERSVLFDYDKVVSGNIKNLPFKEKYVRSDKHFTEVRLRRLESKHVSNWQWEYLRRKITYIYRNFIRTESSFYSNWKEDYVEFNVFGETLKWEEYNFLKEQWYEDRQIHFNDNKSIEWKFKFDWMPLSYDEEVLNRDGDIEKRKSNIEISGFVGILPDGEHSGKNGFSLFRRGRVVEGIDKRVFPIDISGKSARSFKYIRLYGELHFRNVDISFDKTKLAINKETRDEIFTVISGLIKNVEFPEFPGKKFNFISQADKHRAKFSRPTAKKAIESIKTRKKTDLDIKAEELLKNKVYDEDYEYKLLNSSKSQVEIEELPCDENSKIYIGNHEYQVILKFTEMDHQLYLIVDEKIEKKLIIKIGMKHIIFQNNNELLKTPMFNHLVQFIKCIAISEVKASNGRDNAKDVRHAFNDYISLILN